MTVRSREQFTAFTQEFDAKEKARREQETMATIRKEEERLAREIAAAEAKASLFTSPSPVLAKCKQVTTTADTPEKVTADIHNAVSQLKLELSEKGITLEPSAMRLFKQLLDANPTVDSRDVNNWRAMYGLLDSFDVFTDRDRTIVTVEAPVKKRETDPVDAMIALDTRRPEDRAKLKKLAADAEAISARPLWRQFMAFIRDTYGYELSQADKDKVLAYCYESGKGLTVKALNDARIHVLRLRSADEELARTIEQHDQSSVADYEVRRDVAKRIHTLMKPTPDA